MKIVGSLIVLLTGFSTVFGSEKLSDFDRLLDEVERSFWRTVCMGEEEMARQDVGRKIFQMKTLARDLQNEIISSGWSDEFNLPKYTLVIGSAWSDLQKNKDLIAASWRNDFLSTSREQYSSGRKSGGLDGYEAWVESRHDKNMELLNKMQSLTKNKSGLGLRGSKISPKAGDYFFAIRQLRCQTAILERKMLDREKSRASDSGSSKSSEPVSPGTMEQAPPKAGLESDKNNEEEPETMQMLPTTSEDVVGSVRILEASYGSKEKFRNVKELLESKISGGRLVLKVDNSLAGDPHVGAKKELFVRLVTDGNKVREVECPENWILVIDGNNVFVAKPQDKRERSR